MEASLGNLQQDIDVSGECQACLDRMVKANREVILLSLLKERPLCGYDIIKEIFSKYNVFLSQGTVYPILYALEEEGVLRAEYSRGNMRSKTYTLTPKGALLTEEKLDGFRRSLDYMLTIFKE
jgi:PadR family transcriptional regulator PadR